MPRRTTKIDTISRLINRKSGASLEQIQQATGWQPHSIRAAISGLRKVGCEVRRTKTSKGISTYHAIKVTDHAGS